MGSDWTIQNINKKGAVNLFCSFIIYNFMPEDFSASKIVKPSDKAI